MDKIVCTFCGKYHDIFSVKDFNRLNGNKCEKCFLTILKIFGKITPNTENLYRKLKQQQKERKQKER